MTEHLKDSSVKRLPLPKAGNRITYDDEVKGFGIRVTAAGARAFIFNYVTRAGRERRYTIGGFPDWSTVGARDKARELKRKVDDGGDPLGEIEDQRSAPTVAELCDRFEAEHLPRKRPGTAADYKRILANHVRPHFGAHIKVADVDFTHIDALHRKITKAGHLYRANATVRIASKMFSLAIRWGMRTDNPCKGIERNNEAKRKRYLSGDELARLTQVLAAYPDRQTANVFRLLLLTGARKGEVLSACWADIDLGTGTWTKPSSATKQKTDHVVPLSAPARQLLSEMQEQQRAKDRRKTLGTYVFPSYGESRHIVTVKKSWVTICKAANISGLRIHDLRHSFASQLASGGASLPLIGALLGHSNPTTTHRYAHLFDDPQRAATEKVGAIISAASQPAKEPTRIKRRVA